MTQSQMLAAGDLELVSWSLNMVEWSMFTPEAQVTLCPHHKANPTLCQTPLKSLCAHLLFCTSHSSSTASGTWKGSSSLYPGSAFYFIEGVKVQ